MSATQQEIDEIIDEGIAYAVKLATLASTTTDEQEQNQPETFAALSGLLQAFTVLVSAVYGWGASQDEN